ncbi:MAG TPA: tetratricopeptide repeat protein [Candidatus Baltobacteraceae bacterium]|nr:tetratricopeptide repeat protein [Candidatus Baltobacteraceae bacterium]
MNEAAVTVRMAHLHLRTGLPALARAELETLAGRGELTAAAQADLAEARWRGGDLSGAAQAAQAHLDQGGDQVVAEVVVVEALAAAGRHRDARRLAERLLARPDVDPGTLERVFAGHPRSSAWPDRGRADSRPAIAASPARAGVAPAPPVAAPAPAAAISAVAPSAAAGRVRGAPTADRPSDDIAAAETALGRGDVLAAAGLLGVVLREEPALAAMVLSVAERGLAGTGRVGPPPAALHLVRGDALRLLGRTSEASAAFQGSRRALVDAAPREETT